MYYIGLDVHKKTISYCVKDAMKERSRRAMPIARPWPCNRILVAGSTRAARQASARR